MHPAVRKRVEIAQLGGDFIPGSSYPTDVIVSLGSKDSQW